VRNGRRKMDHGSKTHMKKRRWQGGKQVERNSTQRAEVTATRSAIPVASHSRMGAGGRRVPIAYARGKLPSDEMHDRCERYRGWGSVNRER
jgi:hypothetical protein